MTRTATRRRLFFPLVVLAMAVLLSGCFRIKADFVIGEDGTVSGALDIAFSKQALEALQSFGEGFGDSSDDDPLAEFEDDCGADFDGAQAERYDDGEFLGVICRFEGVSLEALTEASEGDEAELTLVRDGDVYRLDGNFSAGDDEGTADPDFDPSAFFQGAEVIFTFTFPGKVTETTGELSNGDRTVTFRLTSFSEPLVMRAVAGATADGGGSMSALLIGIPAAIVGIGLILFLRGRFGGGGAEATPADAEA